MELKDNMEIHKNRLIDYLRLEKIARDFKLEIRGWTKWLIKNVKKENELKQLYKEKVIGAYGWAFAYDERIKELEWTKW